MDIGLQQLFRPAASMHMLFPLALVAGHSRMIVLLYLAEYRETRMALHADRPPLAHKGKPAAMRQSTLKATPAKRAPWSDLKKQNERLPQESRTA